MLLFVVSYVRPVLQLVPGGNQCVPAAAQEFRRLQLRAEKPRGGPSLHMPSFSVEPSSRGASMCSLQGLLSWDLRRTAQNNPHVFCATLLSCVSPRIAQEKKHLFERPAAEARCVLARAVESTTAVLQSRPYSSCILRCLRLDGVGGRAKN